MSEASKKSRKKRSDPGSQSVKQAEPAAPRPPAPELPEEVALPEAPPTPPFTLAIDIGGTGIKCMLLDATGAPSGTRLRLPTPTPATPESVIEVIRTLLPDTHYDRVSVGFPGVVVEGVTLSAPNLHTTWAGFHLQGALNKLTERPVRVLNDAGVQGFGVIEGRGTEAVVTLGTGMGFALYVEGRYVPNIELAHHPLTKRRTYEQTVGNAARKRDGSARWQRRVLRALAQIQATFNPSMIYVGGGNAERLTVPLPANVRRVSNVAGLLGGIALWRHG
jgi:polyphosphate glucokinase